MMLALSPQPHCGNKKIEDGRDSCVMEFVILVHSLTLELTDREFKSLIHLL